MNRRRLNGFTLVELIAVLVIIALITAVGRSLFFDVNVYRERGFYEETLAAARYAQKLAVASGCPVLMQTTITGFTLFRSANAAACAAGPYNTPIADPSGGAATFTRTAPAGVAVDAQSIVFVADGTVNMAPATLDVNVGGRQWRVHRDTGFVERR